MIDSASGYASGMTATKVRNGEQRNEQPGRGRGVALGALVGVLVLVVVAAVVVRGASFSWPNPFGESHKENPNAVVLAELVKQSKYVAASGRFQTVIDSQEDANFLPDALKGSHEVFIAEGDVDGSVEFGGLTEDAITVSPEGDSVTVHVPPAQLGKPALDTAATRLVFRERGLIDRFGEALGGGDPTNQQALYQRAEQKIADAAAKSELTQRTEENTEKFLTSLFEGMGYKQVHVIFDGPKAADR
jgi:hypothetical protein